MANYINIPPDADTNSGGTVTSVGTGAGLAGGPITTSGTLSVASVSLTNQVTGLLPYSNITTARVITAGGTVGSATINALSGTVNFAAAMASLVVTNNTVGTGSFIFATLRTSDATGSVASVVPASGSFTINLVAPAGEVSCAFLVVNGP